MGECDGGDMEEGTDVGDRGEDGDEGDREERGEDFEDDGEDVEEGGEVNLDDMSDTEPTSRMKKTKRPHFQEKPEHEKNQVRDKVKKNQEDGDERTIKNISEIKNKIRRNAEWLKL